MEAVLNSEISNVAAQNELSQMNPCMSVEKALGIIGASSAHFFKNLTYYTSVLWSAVKNWEQTGMKARVRPSNTRVVKTIFVDGLQGC
jgi:hypothetical protein